MAAWRRRRWENTAAKAWGSLALAVGAATFLSSPSAAANPSPPSHVWVLTMGPGEHPFTRFGHNAILLEWPGRASAVYNYGTFEFDGVRGAEDFMAGRFRYWLSVGSLPGTISAYRREGRSLDAQELELSTEERAELAASLAENAKPEHRYYDYDYYRDNCSTRVRDALDRVLHGQLHQAVTGAGRFSFRQHTLRLVGQAPWLYLGLDLALGAPTDKPTTRWEELFLPHELHRALASATRLTPEGVRVPLVRREVPLLSVQGPPEPSAPPKRRFAMTAAGSLLGALLGTLALAARNRAWLRVLHGVLTAVLGLTLGPLSIALVIFSGSKHWAAHDNRALWGLPAWLLALTVIGVGVALGKPWAERWLRRVLGACAVSSFILLLLAVLPSGHESLRMAGLFLPLWLGWYWGVRRWENPATSANAPTSIQPVSERAR